VRLITGLEIEGFRSILHETIAPVDGFTCLIGENNSGKSNVLRALNLFFTDETEPQVDFDIARDYYKDPKKKKKRQIAVTVDFELPDNFKFPKRIADIEKTLGRRFSIRRTWTPYYDEYRCEIRKRSPRFRNLDEPTFWQFSQLINFRYIQNRIIPSQALKLEASKFRSAVINRLRRRRATEADQLLQALNQAATDELNSTSEIVRRDITSLRKIVIGLPEAAELFGLSGFGAEIATGALVTDDTLGAGSQAYIMFHLLKLVDTKYASTFGWRQATVWAVEEPETSLHRDLVCKLAATLRSWADEYDLRMQIIGTTHSEVVATAATNGFLVRLEDRSRTSIKSEKLPDLVHLAATSGVSGIIEPILCYSTNTVVLTEGSLNRMVLERVSAKTQTACGCKFVTLSDIDTLESASGVDNIIDYLKRWGKIIPNRAQSCPLIVLLDYDVDDEKLEKARRFYGTDGSRRVLRMNVVHADSRVSRSTRGVERFYPRSLFVEARKKNIVAVSEDQKGVVSIEKANMTLQVKNKLAHLLCGGKMAWCKHLRYVLEDVEKAAS
jgi:energy-coupling factor transporter ATP-binding protein EcfA2